MIKTAIFALLISFATTAFAATPTLCVNHWCLTPNAFDVLYQNAKAQQPNITEKALKTTLVNRHLIAAYANQQSFDWQDDKHHVGFSAASELQQNRYALYHRAFNAEFVAFAQTHLTDEGLKPYLTSPPHLQGADIDAALELNNKQRIGMTDAQRQQAKTVVLATYQFPSLPQQTITLASIYDQQNLQGRHALHTQPAQPFLQDAVKSELAQAYFFWWLDQQAPLKAEERQAIDQALIDRQINDAWLKQQGLLDIMHADNTTPALKAAMQNVTDKQINDWYGQHKKEFAVVDQVQAFHIACATQEQCSQAKKALEAGQDAKQVAKQYADKHIQQTLNLGVLTREKNRMQWIANAAMMQKVGQFSIPLRAPDGHWEVIWITDKKSDVLPASDLTIQHQARRSLAQSQLLDDYTTLLNQLRQQAKVIE